MVKKSLKESKNKINEAKERWRMRLLVVNKLKYYFIIGLFSQKQNKQKRAKKKPKKINTTCHWVNKIYILF